MSLRLLLLSRLSSALRAACIAALFAAASLSHAEDVVLTLSGRGATGSLNLVGFDNEINEPNAIPPSSQHVSGGNSSSHGFAYFQYVYDAENPDIFNDYANEDFPGESFWSIIVSSHVVDDVAYYDSVLNKAGAVAYSNLTTETVVVHPDLGVFNLGALTYDPSGLSGVGLETIPAGGVDLIVTRSDYTFNALNEPTEPGTWVGSPYYYWGADQYTLSVRDLMGPGLLFRDGILVGVEIQAVAEIQRGTTIWVGTLRVTERGFAYNINESRFVSPFGGLHIVFDRQGPLTLPGNAGGSAEKLELLDTGTDRILNLNGWPSHGYRIEVSTGLTGWTLLEGVSTDAMGQAVLPLPDSWPDRAFFRAVRLAPGELLP